LGTLNLLHRPSFVQLSRIFIILCLSLSFPSSGYAEWQTRAVSQFILHYQTVDASVARAITRDAEDIYQRLTDLVSYTPPATIYVYLCPTSGCFHQHHPGNTALPDWAVGVAYPQLNRIVMRTHLGVEEGGHIRPVEVFQHELAHIVLEQALSAQGGAPRWLSEGFSMYAAAQWTTHGQRTLEETALRDAFLPLTVLTTSFPADEEAAHMAYAQSFSIVSFLIKTYGKYAFQDLILNLRDGMDTNSALLHATGRSLKSVEQEWQEALRRRYSWWMYAVRYGGIWFVLSVLFLIAYAIKRVKMRRIRAQWEIEEAWEVSEE
jgi:hypothetical protein